MVGELVRVYYNSHRRCFSIQTRAKGPWRLAFHTTDLCLKNATFKIYERGRLRTIKTGIKTVHAMIIGELSENFSLDRPVKIRYNPFTCGDFVSEDGTAIERANFVLLKNSKVFVGEAD